MRHSSASRRSPLSFQAGDLNQRVNIWSAGWHAFVQAPWLGTGADRLSAPPAWTRRIQRTTPRFRSLPAEDCAPCSLRLHSRVAVRALTRTRGPLLLAFTTALLVWMLTSLVATVRREPHHLAVGWDWRRWQGGSPLRNLNAWLRVSPTVLIDRAGNDSTTCALDWRTSRLMSTIAKVRARFSEGGRQSPHLPRGGFCGGGRVLVKLVAMLKEVSVAGVYGRSDAMDAFLMAALIPGLLINLISESMNQALVPT